MLTTQSHIVFAVVESIYVIYMLNFFKTRYSLAHPLTYFNNSILYHPIGKAEQPICNICTLGNYGAYLIALFALLRMIVLTQSPKKENIRTIKVISYMGIITVFTLSLLNFNAVVYLLPYFIGELWYLKSL